MPVPPTVAAALACCRRPRCGWLGLGRWHRRRSRRNMSALPARTAFAPIQLGTNCPRHFLPHHRLARIIVSPGLHSFPNVPPLGQDRQQNDRNERGTVANMSMKSFDFFVCWGLNRFTDLNAMQMVVRIPQSIANAGSGARPLVRFSPGVWHLVPIVRRQAPLTKCGPKGTTIYEDAFCLSGVDLPQSV